MKRAAILFVLFASSLFASNTEAQVPPLPPPMPKEAVSPYPIAPPRLVELQTFTALQLDWNGRTDRPADAGIARASFLGGVDIVMPFLHQRLRPSFFVGVLGGKWGDDVHGDFSFVPGLRFRGSFIMDDVFDVYGLARADFPFSLTPNVTSAMRTGLGAGIRVGRIVSLELTWDLLVPISSTFHDTTFVTALPAAASGALLFDLCFPIGCSPAKPKQQVRNVSCVLYEKARSVGKGVCDAIPDALQTAPDPRRASRMEDGTSTFLAALVGAVKDPKTLAALKDLAQLHDELLWNLSNFQRREAAFACEDLKLSERWIYTPVPSELRQYFGCMKATPPRCEELTDAP